MAAADRLGRVSGVTATTAPGTEAIGVRPRRPLALLVVSALLLVAGCGTPPWLEAGGTGTPTAADPSPVRSTAAPARNDLAKGSLKRTLTAGGVRLTATYFSTLDMSAWTPAASKPLTLSVVGRFADGSKQNIHLSRLSMTTDVTGPDGPLPGPAPMVDESAAPGYLIKAPTSYGQVFTLPALDPAARSVTLLLTYELLVQTAPKSADYAKQAASDTVVIALAG